MAYTCVLIRKIHYSRSSDAPLVTLTPSTVNPSTNKVTLTCEAEAFPNFSVTGGSNQATWLKNDFSVPVEERIEESESVFSNNPFKQTLVNEITVDCELNVLYKCSVMNAQGTSTDTAAVCGGGEPLAFGVARVLGWHVCVCMCVSTVYV